MKTIKLWDGLTLEISDTDWDFLCNERLCNLDPSPSDIRAEFVSGTGITKNKPERYSQASEAFAEYIQDLREISQIDINQMARNLIPDEEKI